MTYPIAQRFSHDHRLQVVNDHTFTPSHSGGVFDPREQDGYCPLGLLLLTHTDGHTIIPTPTATDVAAALLAYDDATDEPLSPAQRDQYDAIVQEAESFIHDWDNGAILDLPTALGVEGIS